MSVRLIVDSTADLAAGVRERLTVVPLSIFFGSEEYVDGVSITHREFYEKLVESDVLPTTSQPTPEAFAEVFRKARDAGDSVVVLTISSKLSGTYQSAAIAARDFSDVHVVDSLNVAIGSGILAQYALELIERGLSAEEVAHELTEARGKVRLVAMLDTLEYLKRGGRISKTEAFAGSLLSIKPVIDITDGAIRTVGKARGSKQGNNLLIREIETSGGVDFSKPLLLGYTGLSDALLQKYIRDSAALWAPCGEELPVTIVGSVVGTHAGPGAVAVAFFNR